MEKRTFESEEIAKLFSPIVYVFRRGEKILYIGFSACGVGRPFSPSHKMNQLPEKPAMDIDVYFFDLVEEAFEFEQRLLSQYRTEYNKEIESQNARRQMKRHKRRPVLTEEAFEKLREMCPTPQI